MPKVGRAAVPNGPAGGALPKTSEERMQHQLDVVTKDPSEDHGFGTTSLATLVEPGDTATMTLRTGSQ